MAITTNARPSHQHCTLAVIRALTQPLVVPPAIEELRNALLKPWNLRVPVDKTDCATQHHWQDQKHTALFESMFDWEANEGKSTASLHPYFSFSLPSTFQFFVPPWKEVGNCLRQLLFHQIGSRQTCDSITLTSHHVHLFVATAAFYPDGEIVTLKSCTAPGYFLLRCHHDVLQQQLVFGYHTKTGGCFQTFHRVIELSLQDEDWRPKTCVILTNLARIIHCLKDYTIPLNWNQSEKLSIVQQDQTEYIQKVYKADTIGGISNATVSNMIDIYLVLEKANVPHTDRLASVKKLEDKTTICQFNPIGRSYLPENLDELLCALICVAEALVAMHSLHIVHRDIRWANVFHALSPDREGFTNEWVLFDFEFAAWAPQPAFASHTLTPGNHAPEMVDTDLEHHSQTHGAAVDVWGLGYLMKHAHVDIPASHEVALEQLQGDCLQADPKQRPTAEECLDRLKKLIALPKSNDKLVEWKE